MSASEEPIELTDFQKQKLDIADGDDTDDDQPDDGGWENPDDRVDDGQQWDRNSHHDDHGASSWQMPLIYRGTEIEQFPRPEPLVKGIINRQTIGSIYGPSSSGKTFYAVALALSVVSGREFFGHEVHKGPVLFVAAEGVSGLQLRQRAWMDERGVNGDEIDDMYWMPQNMDLRNSEHVRVVGEYMDEHGVVFVIADTLNRNMPGTDEGAIDMGLAAAALTELSHRGDRAAAFAISHAGKDVNRGNRGHSSLKGALDHEFQVTGGDGTIKVKDEKQRDAESAPTVTYGLEKVSVIIGGETYDSATLSLELNQPQTRKNLEHILQVLTTLDDGTGVGIANGIWQEACEEKHGISRSTFHVLRAEASKGGLIEQDKARKPWRFTELGRKRVILS